MALRLVLEIFEEHKLAQALALPALPVGAAANPVPVGAAAKPVPVGAAANPGVNAAGRKPKHYTAFPEEGVRPMRIFILDSATQSPKFQ